MYKPCVSQSIQLILLALFLCCCSSPAHQTLQEKVDKILVFKSKREMQLLRDQRVLRVYKIALGGNPVGHKKVEGDNKTPEGLYKIVQHNPKSQFYKSLRISYPNEADRKAANQLGKDAGGDIMIHGLGKGFAFLGKAHVLHDWTLGCIAVTNEEIDEIFTAVADGTPIEIRP